MLEELPDWTTVLVAVVTRRGDLERALQERWYRIPVATAPRPLAAEILALYQTGRFGADGHCIRYLAPILSYQLRRRIELLPEESGHPRAHAFYYQLGLGPIETLARPLPSARLRRVTFISTTLGRVIRAADVRELWSREEALSTLCDQLRLEGFAPAARRLREQAGGACCPICWQTLCYNKQPDRRLRVYATREPMSNRRSPGHPSSNARRRLITGFGLAAVSAAADLLAGCSLAPASTPPPTGEPTPSATPRQGDIFSDQAPPPDERIFYGPERLHFADLRLPAGPGPHPVVAMVHGGFWRARYDLEHTGHLCAALTAAGVATWNIEYRRLGNDGGGWPGTFQDVALALDYLRQIADAHHLDLRRVVTLGHSAGGHLAFWLAARHRIPLGAPLFNPDPLPLRAAVSLAGVVDLRRGWELGLSQGVVAALMDGTPDDQPERYAAGSPIELLPLGIPQTLVHGLRDDTVPPEISRRYHEAAVAAGDRANLLELPSADHFALIDPWSEEWPQIRDLVIGLAAG